MEKQTCKVGYITDDIYLAHDTGMGHPNLKRDSLLLTKQCLH